MVLYGFVCEIGIHIFALKSDSVGISVRVNIINLT